MRLIAILFAYLVLSSCASVNFNYEPETFLYSEPEQGITHVAYVGDQIARMGTYREANALLISTKSEVGSTVGIGGYSVSPGYYTQTGENNAYTFYVPSRVDGGAVATLFFSDPWFVLAVPNDSTELCVVTISKTTWCSKVPAYELTRQQWLRSGDVEQTLLYNGRINDKVNFSYREFYGGNVRPSFSNQVEYDLKESSTFAYKGARIEVIEATNELIRYRLISNF